MCLCYEKMWRGLREKRLRDPAAERGGSERRGETPPAVARKFFRVLAAKEF